MRGVKDPPQNSTHREVKALVPHRLRPALRRLRDARGVAHREQAHRVSGRARRAALESLHAGSRHPHVKQKQNATRIVRGDHQATNTRRHHSSVRCTTREGQPLKYVTDLEVRRN